MKSIRFHRLTEKAIKDWPLSTKVELADLLSFGGWTIAGNARKSTDVGCSVRGA